MVFPMIEISFIPDTSHGVTSSINFPGWARHVIFKIAVPAGKEGISIAICLAPARQRLRRDMHCYNVHFKDGSLANLITERAICGLRSSTLNCSRIYLSVNEHS